MAELLPKLLSSVEINPPGASHSVIWLHGLGADGHDFEPVVNELDLDKPIRFIFPHAPSMPVTINNGFVMPAWYDIVSQQIDSQQDEAGVRHSQLAIIALIENEIARGINPENIILAGFSQGGAIALHTGLRYPRKLAGIMGLSTYLPLADSLANEAADANRATAIFLGHGTFDPIVPFELAIKTQDQLNQLHYSTELKKYPMEHSVYPEEINDISDWINRCFT